MNTLNLTHSTLHNNLVERGKWVEARGRGFPPQVGRHLLILGLCGYGAAGEGVGRPARAPGGFSPGVF